MASAQCQRPCNRAIRTSGAKPLTAAPVRWGVLYGLALVALLSHLLLDYTNNYGLRPFFPFNGRWYAASIVFIFDPLMFVLLLGALILPWLFGLVNAEVGAKKQPFVGRGWAIAALVGILGWWGLREVEHARAVQMAMTQTMVAPTPASATDTTQPPDGSQSQDAAQSSDTDAYVPTFLPARAALASPDLLSPFRWSAVMDFGPVYRLAEIDTYWRNAYERRDDVSKAWTKSPRYWLRSGASSGARTWTGRRCRLSK